MKAYGDISVEIAHDGRERRVLEKICDAVIREGVGLFQRGEFVVVHPC